MTDSPHEVALVEGAIAGQADAFGQLYELHIDAIYRYIYLRVGDVHDAQDLTEQVFLKAWEALPGYKLCGNPFKSWLYRIAHNAVVDYHRGHGRAAIPLREDQDDESEQPAALDQVIKAEENQALAKAIAQLPEEQQQMIVLRFVEGLSHDEISRIVNKSRGACRVMQHRTLVALNRLLKHTKALGDA